MAAGAVAVTVPGFGLLLGRPLRDDGLGRQQHAGDRGRVAYRGAGDLDRVDDTGLHQVAVLPGRGIQAVAGGQLPHLAHDDVALVSCVLRDPAQRLDERRADDVDARGLVTGEPAVAGQRARRRDECAAAAGDDALLDRGTGGRDRVLEPVLALLELDLRCPALAPPGAPAPTGMMPPPPARFASRSCSFSRSQSESLASISPRI